MKGRFEGIKISQKETGYRFTQDSIILANFVECNFNMPLIDLGTGSGIIPLLIAKRCKGKRLFGIEINKELFKVAKKNIKLNNMEDRIEIVLGDLKNIKNFFLPDTFEVVVTNPPYYGRNEGLISKDPEKKIAKAEFLSDLSSIFKTAFYLLKEKGSFYFIYPTKKLQSVFLTARRYQFTPKKIRFIHYNIKRDAELFLVKMGKRTKEGLIVGPPVIIEERKDL